MLLTLLNHFLLFDPHYPHKRKNAMSSQNSSRFFSYIINSVVQGLLPRTKRNRYKIGTPLIDIPTGWDPQAKQQQRAALADFSAAPWQGFEKSERGPNNSSLFQPQAAVVVVALWLCLRHKCRPVRAPSLAQKEKPAHNVYWFLVRWRGLEPPRINHTHLKRARLPVPPPSHTVLFSQP